MSAFDEIQTALYAQRLAARSLGVVALKMRPCALCDHDRYDHSQILPLEPCLDCDCGSWTDPYPRPDPTRKQRW